MDNFKTTLQNLQNQGFVVRDGIIGGETVYLVFPQHGGVEWNKNNLIYRSSIWDKDGNPVSLSFKKFFNWSEQPNLVPDPDNIKKTVAIEKIDGSCLIVSYFKGQLITRTRGTIDAHDLPNGPEIDYLKKQYPNAFSNEYLLQEDCSFIYEWVTPNNKIILDYGENPDIYLTGFVSHCNYQYACQDMLNNVAKELGVKRPTLYKFDNISNMIESVKAFKDKEGVCVYFNHEQEIKKVKSIDYLTKHHFKSNLSYDNMIDMYLNYEMPSYQEFLDKITGDFDFELSEMSRPVVSKIIDAKREIDKFIAHAKKFIEPLKSVSRKEAAQIIMQAYGTTNRCGYVFNILDGKELKKDAIKKLLFQVIK